MTWQEAQKFREWLTEKQLEADEIYLRIVSFEEWDEGETLRTDLYRTLKHA